MEETLLTQGHGSLGRTLRKMDSHTKNRECVQGAMRDHGKANGVTAMRETEDRQTHTRWGEVSHSGHGRFQGDPGD